ncbi:MAG: hypothetical protein AAGF56_13740, partial [Pseudomonadota bacterium]
MDHTLTEQQIREAQENCAEEPVRIPGQIQPFATLLAVSAKDGRLTHASANAEPLLGKPVQQAFEVHARDLLGSDIWH